MTNINPFKFGDPVEGDYYLARPELMKSVRQFVDNRVHIVLIGSRRFGKTSFVLELLRQMKAEKPDCIGIFVDVYNITSHRDFLQQLLRALRSKQVLWDRFLDRIKSIPKLAKKITWEHDLFGSLSAEFSERDAKDSIQDILGEMAKLGEHVVIVIDEFQKISEIGDDGWLEATLRTQMQSLKNTSFVFTGSRRSVIYDMLNNQTRPFYRSCQTLEFPPFGDEFTNWVIERFSGVGISCDNETVNYLRQLVQDTPNYVQMICFHLVASGIRHVTRDTVDATLRTVVRQNAYAYQTLLATLSLGQQRALRLAALENQGVFSQDRLDKYEIASGAALTVSFRALKSKQILDEEGTGRGRVVFDDPLFAIWLRIEFGNQS